MISHLSFLRIPGLILCGSGYLLILNLSICTRLKYYSCHFSWLSSSNNLPENVMDICCILFVVRAGIFIQLFCSCPILFTLPTYSSLGNSPAAYIVLVYLKIFSLFDHHSVVFIHCFSTNICSRSPLFLSFLHLFLAGNISFVRVLILLSIPTSLLSLHFVGVPSFEVKCWSWISWEIF